MNLESEKNLEQALNGQTIALQKLLLESYDKLASVISPRIPEELRSVCEVEDIMQVTFVQVYQDFHGFRGQTMPEFLAWTRVIAEAKLVDAIRAANRKKRGGNFNQVNRKPGLSKSYLNLLEQLDGTDRSPSQSIAAKDAIEAIQVSIAALPEDQRDAITLRYLQNMPLLEVAKTMERSEDAARGLLHRAKISLKSMMGNSSAWFTKLT